MASFGSIRLATQPPQIQQPEIGPRLGSPLRRREPAPAHRLGIVRRHGNPGREPQISIPFGGLPVGCDGRPIPTFAGAGLPVKIDETELKLRLEMTLLGRAAVPSDRVRRVANDALSAGIGEAKAVLRLRVPGAGGPGKTAERDRIAVPALRPDPSRKLPRSGPRPELA